MFLNKRHPILPCTSVEQSSRHMTFEFFEWNIACFQVVRVRKTLSSSTESKLFCFVWPMEDSSSYEVRERIIQVVHVREMILSLEITWTEPFWYQGWDELNLSLRLFTCVSVLHTTRLRLPNSIAAKSASVSFLLWKFNGANLFSNFWAFFCKHDVSQEKSITTADVVLKTLCLNVTVQRNNKRTTIRLSDVIQNY